jgi:hypothetical protein
MYALDITTFGGRETILDIPVSNFFRWIAAGESSEIVYALPSV